jgi:hypothetical protein
MTMKAFQQAQPLMPVLHLVLLSEVQVLPVTVCLLMKAAVIVPESVELLASAVLLFVVQLAAAF